MKMRIEQIKQKFAIDGKYMSLAIGKARQNLRTLRGGPFGACIVRDGKVLALSHNTVLSEDATCHAEINAIRVASRAVKSYDLSGSVIYSTTEPCPMCFCAIHWSRIACVVYGTTIKDAEEIGFNEMKIGNRQLKTLGKSSIELVPGFMRAECARLFSDWDALPNKKLY